jgi:hypothetical protein
LNGGANGKAAVPRGEDKKSRGDRKWWKAGAIGRRWVLSERRISSMQFGKIGKEKMKHTWKSRDCLNVGF